MTTEAKELIAVPPTETALAVFTAKEGLEPWLLQVRAEIDKFNKTLPELKTNKGREAYASMAYKIAKSKTALDAVGKKLSAEQKEVPKLIDAERKRVWDKLELWQKEVRKPLDDWEAAETARKDRHVDAIQVIADLTDGIETLTASELRGGITTAEAIEIGEHFEEFEAEAARTKDHVLTKLRAALAARQQYEDEQAELTKLREEKEARDKKDHEDRIAREAAEQATREAEEKARLERDAQAQRARDDQAAAEKRENDLKLAAAESERKAEQAKREKIEAEQKAEADRLAAIENQKLAVEQAKKDEEARQKAAADEIIRQQQIREADTKHKSKVMAAAKVELIKTGITEEQAKKIVLAICKGLIPNVAISF